MSMSHKFSIPLFASAAAILLAGCSQPHMFPTGYTYHKDTYKSATPPPSEKFTNDQRKTMTAEQAEQFRQAVYKLTERLTLRAGMPPKPVYVLKPEKMSAFYSNIDNNLHKSLRHLGYTLANSPEGAYIFTYTAQSLRTLDDLKNPDGTQIDPATLSSNNVRLALQVHDKIGEDSKMLTEEADTFYISGAEYLTVPYNNFLGVFLPNDGGQPANNSNFSATPSSSEGVAVRPAPAPAPVDPGVN